ncbi:hypothetical protein B0I35DRAFT_197903 [Stachybotrys elegans]|uniref:Fe2OG dioxygenase domain-containing protein n=1 Tax=Stachybotrys elegans TaxID=80388 RepID=A0A8K0SPC5_9HYPO|nr:hypothetical protein B0I35DRAFT_197903 [Stachybotrys elegans]
MQSDFPRSEPDIMAYDYYDASPSDTQTESPTYDYHAEYEYDRNSIPGPPPARPDDIFFAPDDHPAGKPLLMELLKSLQSSNRRANFACGGSVTVASTDAADDSSSSPRSTPPVVVRWDDKTQTSPSRSGEGPTVFKAVFTQDEADVRMVEKLVLDCQPATFGRGQEDVLDETYRKAGKLEPSQFSTNFCPYDTGIVDAITAMLMTDSLDGEVMLGVRAQLYKLNVYSGPEGKFKSHVDTPRGEKQFGSLVVCLPFQHSGGVLEVRHDGKVAEFDWSTNSSHSGDIQWAAFYSDCEHEVMSVTQGHRVTLTYNLYYKSVNRSWPAVPLPIDGTKTPFYQTMRNIMQLPVFLKEGGLLGIYCSHSYPHAHPTEYVKVPFMLKGGDAAIYRSLMAIPGLSVRLLPILGKDIDRGFQMKIRRDETPAGKPWRDGSFKHLRDKMFGQVQGPESNKESRWQWYEPVISHIDLAGVQLQPWKECIDICVNSASEVEEMFQRSWPLQRLRDVQWLNEPESSELSLDYIAHGNDASMEYVYTSLAFIISVPPHEERTKSL